jgi:hypothetical protein
MTGPIECSKVFPCVILDHWPQVTFLGPKDEWCKVACRYTHLYEMNAEIAYNWLHVWIGAKHPSFEGCTINTSDNVHQQMNNVTNKIIQDTITTYDSSITVISIMLDTENEENTESMNVTNSTSSLYDSLCGATKTVINQCHCQLSNQCHVENNSSG